MYEWPLHKGGIATGTKAYYGKRGYSPLMMSQGYPYDVTSEGIPHNNKLKYHRSSYMHAKSADSDTI